MNLIEKINKSKDYISSVTDIKPEIGLILGSGLGILADRIENSTTIKYNEIPYFPESTVKGHKGQLVIGELEGKKVIAMQGRFHYYEGYEIGEVTFPVRVFKALGINKIIVTNAAGSVNTEYTPGDLMIINSHINFAFNNPLIGKNYDELGPRFPDMTNAYSPKLIELTKKVAKNLNIDIKEGSYMWFTGPTYETPAEIKMARLIGADAVGMSTVPEVIVARHSDLEVLGISCITNMAAGILDQPLTHTEVIETTERVKESFIELVSNILREI